MELADEYFHKVLQLAMENELDILNLHDYDITIHCMGEPSFVWYFNSIARKWSNAIHIVVSTTERNVVEETKNGVTTKVVKFQFVRFREII